jgi:hypothetical protein
MRQKPDLDYPPFMSQENDAKAMADVFEIVVGVYYEAHGFRELQDWLDEIYEPLIGAAQIAWWVMYSHQLFMSLTSVFRINLSTESRTNNQLKQKSSGTQSKRKKAKNMHPSQSDAATATALEALVGQVLKKLGSLS